MNFKIFHRANYLGEYPRDELFHCKNVVSTGTIINFASRAYIVSNIMVRQNGEVILEVI